MEWLWGSWLKQTLVLPFTGFVPDVLELSLAFPIPQVPSELKELPVSISAQLLVSSRFLPTAYLPQTANTSNSNNIDNKVHYHFMSH